MVLRLCAEISMPRELLSVGSRLKLIPLFGGVSSGTDDVAAGGGLSDGNPGGSIPVDWAGLGEGKPSLLASISGADLGEGKPSVFGCGDGTTGCFNEGNPAAACGDDTGLLTFMNGLMD